MTSSPIRTPDQRLRIFVSSTLAELAEERAAVRETIDRLHLAPVMFELGARPYPPRELYRAYLEQSQIFVGIYWQRYGWVAPGESVSGLEDEYRLSRGMPRLLYVKAPAPEREPGLIQLLRQIQDDDTASYKAFRTADELAQLVAADLALLLSEQFTRSALPTGVVTFLAADNADATDDAELVRHVVTAHHGHRIASAAEITCIAFARPSDALSAAADLRRMAAERGAPPFRVAVHSAVAQPDADGYPTAPLDRLSRMVTAGHGGQVLLSAAVVDLLDDRPAPPLTLRSLGAHRLTEGARVEEIHQLDLDGFPADFPPLRTPDRPRHNLPVQLNSFVGREHELALVTEAVAQSRLTTLTGAGGSGKSRLAVWAATDLVTRFRDGVWLVELATLTDPQRIASAIAAALDVRDEPQRTTVDTLTDDLRHKDLLIVLDNCEHVLAACAELTAALLRAAPAVRVLATSREALAVPGEAIVPVPSLSVPPPGTAITDAVTYPAVRLFTDRARAVRPDFTVTARNVTAVTQIVARLDGIPLALELAAARVKMLSVDQIAARLSDQFRLLRGGPRTVMPRQQTLRAAMDWSHDLLTAPERALLRRLSVFNGGLTVEAAETVCAGNGIDADDVLELLARLVDKSLVTVVSGAEENRYRLLETVRQYASERLAEADETDAVHTSHRDWCRTAVETAARHLLGDAEQTRWLHRLDADHDNLQAALRWSVDRGDADAALRISVGAAWFWYLRGHWDTARQWLDRSIALPDGDATLRARAGAWAAIFAWKRGDLNRAEQLADDSLNRLAGSRDEGEGLSLLALTLVALSRTEPEKAREYGRRTLEVFRAQQHTWGVTTSLLVLARVASNRGSDDLPALLRESASLLTSGTDAWGRAHMLTLQGNEALRTLDLPRATQLHMASHAIVTELGDPAGQAENLLALGHTALLQGDTANAENLLRGSRAILDQLQDPHYLAHADEAIALLEIARGDAARGEALLTDVANRFAALDKRAMGSTYAIGMADIYGRAHQPLIAAALLRHALSLIDEDADPVRYAEAHNQLTAVEQAAAGLP